MREAVFVINPARTRHVELLTARCREAAVQNGWGALFMGTEPGETGPVLSSHLEAYAGRSGDRLVFAVGGDGTIRACAHALAGRGVALAIVPRGTANLLARALGVPSDLAAALSTGFSGRDVDVDLPEADGQTFVAMAGLGIDAARRGCSRTTSAGSPMPWPRYPTSSGRPMRSRCASMTPSHWSGTLTASWSAM
jgi:hypothetical protein